MPPCKNDNTKTFKGTEPSPKGLGYCAHSEKIGTIKKGKDGNEWIIIKSSNNVKKWIKNKKKESQVKNINDIIKILSQDEFNDFYDILIDKLFSKKLVLKNTFNFFTQIKKELKKINVHFIIDYENINGYNCGAWGASELFWKNKIDENEMILWFCIQNTSFKFLHNKNEVLIKVIKIFKLFCNVKSSFNSKTAINLKIPDEIFEKDKIDFETKILHYFSKFKN